MTRSIAKLALLAFAEGWSPRFASRAPLTARRAMTTMSSHADGPEMNKISKRITQPKSQGASQAMLYATGLQPEDMNKAQVGIGSVWYDGNPCNMHLLEVAAGVKRSVQANGMVGLRFNSIGVSDGISNGTDGMAYSLQSRDLIADGIETVMGAQFYDANVSIPGCDKNMPGCAPRNAAQCGAILRASLQVCAPL